MVAKECAECVVAGKGIELLLKILEDEDSESLRLVTVECLFFFIIRNEVGRLAIVMQKGIPTFISCLGIETSSIVRSYYCAILREYASIYPNELLKENMISVCDFCMPKILFL
jgi:hypothetical protein